MKWFKRLLTVATVSIILVVQVNNYIEKEKIKNEAYMKMYGYEYDERLKEWVK